MEGSMDHLTFDHLDNKLAASPRPSPKCDPAWILKRIDLLMSSYRKTDYLNLEGFIATMGSILEDYPQAIVEYITDPKTGLQRRCKWPPTPAEVVEACAAEIAWRTKIAQNSGLSPVPRLPAPRFSAEDSYEMMFKKYGRPTGIFERPGDEWSRRSPKQEV
jgi:hypothetical protein